jgi:hypothetical protein
MMVNAQADAQIQTVVIPAQARGNAKKRANAVDACKKHQPQETSKPEIQHRPPSTYYSHWFASDLSAQETGCRTSWIASNERHENAWSQKSSRTA